jgi:protein-disulfide isomerase
LTVGAVLLAVVAIGALQLVPRGSAGAATPGTRTAAGILVPAEGTPDAMATGRSIGLADAPLTLTIWSDFQCPACRQFAQTVEPRLIRDYVTPGKLRILYRDLLVIGPESHAAAVASRCAEDQDAFWPYHDVLFANQAAENSGALSAGRLADMADAVGLDRGTFDACVGTGHMTAMVDAETLQGQGRGKSTPTLDFGSLILAGSPPYADLTAKIDGLLAGTPVK